MPPRVVSVAIPFRLVRVGPSDEYTTELLMVSSRKHPHRFIFPKGGWEEKLKETLAEAAVREAGEEAGIIAHPMDPSTKPFFTIADPNGKCLYHFFSVAVQSLAPTWLEDSERVRVWVNLDEAKVRLEAWTVKTKMELAEGLELWVRWWEKGGKDEQIKLQTLEV